TWMISYKLLRSQALSFVYLGTVKLRSDAHDIFQAVQGGLGAVPSPCPGLHAYTPAGHGSAGGDHPKWLDYGKGVYRRFHRRSCLHDKRAVWHRRDVHRTSTREWVLVRT